MNNGVITLVLILFCTTGFSQNYKFEYSGRFNPQIKKEKLNEVNLVVKFHRNYGRNFNYHTMNDKNWISAEKQISRSHILLIRRIMITIK